MYAGNQFYLNLHGYDMRMSVYVHIQVNVMIACHFKTLWVQESLALSSAQSSSRAQYYDCFCC